MRSAGNTEIPHQLKNTVMKKYITVLFFVFGLLTVGAQDKTATAKKPAPNKELITVEASCGQCQFGLPGKSCDLAVKLNGKAYFVDGVHIDSLGDAHAKDGFCNAIRKAKVQGELVNNRFKASYFVLVKK